MICVELKHHDSRWDEFVLDQSDGTFFHLWKWRKLLQRSFGYEPFYLSVEEDGKIHGLLPLFLVKSYLFGRSMVALPLGVYGGVVASSEKATEILVQRAVELAQQHKARYLELRGNPYNNAAIASMTNGSLPRCEQKDLYFTFVGTLHSDEESNFAAIPRKQRRMIRQGEKHGLKAVFDNRRLSEFYKVYATSVRNLGTPVYSYQYFESLLETFKSQCQIVLVEYCDKVIAGVMAFFFKDQVLPYYGGALKEYFHLAPNDFMYWELMRYGAANGHKVFDFGRSKVGTGPFNFKRHWGFEPRPLPYWYFPLTGHGIPDTSPLNPSLQWAIRMWRGLPLKLTMALGPHIVRHIP